MKVPVHAHLDEALVRFLDAYRERHRLPSRNAALAAAIEVLRANELEREYAHAMDGWAASDDAGVWDATAGDGIESDEAR